MSLTPGYGETPVPDDELAALLADAVHTLGEPVTRAAVSDLEQGIQEQVAEERCPTGCAVHHTHHNSSSV
jgi:hypothetical protein